MPRDGTPMFLHCAVCVRKPYQIMTIFTIRQCGSPCPRQILYDTLNGFPVCITWVVQELGNHRHCKSDIGSGCHSSVHKAAYCLLIGHMPHMIGFGRCGRGIVSGVNHSWYHGHGIGLCIFETITFKDRVDV